MLRIIYKLSTLATLCVVVPFARKTGVVHINILAMQQSSRTLFKMGSKAEMVKLR